MYRIFGLALSALAVAGCISRPSLDFKQEVWTAQQTGVKDRLNAVQFLDANHGYVLGENGLVLKTSDGGASWTAIYPTAVAGQQLIGLSFLNALQGFAISDTALFQTDDGGATWRELRDFEAKHTDRLRAVTFLTPHAGFVVGKKGVYQTLDGSDWTRVDITRASAVAKAGASAFVAGDYVYRTALTGVYEGVPASGDICRGDKNDPCSAAMSFPSPTEGWLFAGAGTPSDSAKFTWVLKRTRDGGQSWSDGDPQGQLRKLMPVVDEYLPHVAFASADRGWVILGGDFAATSDGGQTWHRQKQFARPDKFAEWSLDDPVGGFHDISVVDAAHAWIVGSAGRVYKYENKNYAPWVDDNGLQIGAWRCCP